VQTATNQEDVREVKEVDPPYSLAFKEQKLLHCGVKSLYFEK